MSNEDKKSSLLIYVEDFIEKHDNQSLEKDSVVIQTNEDDLVSRIDNKKNSYLILIE
jgi:hypothetical protein